MPFVRDIAWNQETVTTDAGVTVPMPSYAENDLLLAFIQSDTGAPTVTSAGWTQVFTRSNTTSLTVLRKIASASEPASVTFAANVNETYNGAIVAVGDVDTTTPINVSNDTTQASAARYAFQTVVTTRDNCLVLFAGTNSTAAVPSVIEGPVIGVLGADGSAESMGIGWTMQPVAGTTPSNVFCSNVSTGAGVKAVIAINPPVGGATVVPAFCAGDSSRYVDPINGTSAFNGNASLGATADTLFGAALNGVTVVDATVAATADVGLNSFHSVGQLTTPTGSANWGGAALDLSVANVVNASGKNVLVHTRPSTPGQIQRFPGVSASKKGIAFGMLSTAGNWRAWYVHAAGTAWGQQGDVPLVIHPDNTSGRIQDTGALNAASVDVFGFWVASLGVSTTVWQFYSLWVLDTTVVCGGNAAFPVGVPGIVLAASTGHERRSVIQQGVNQALVLQPIQLGDGSTPIFLDLNATAIEFPRIHSLSDRDIFYCSVDNVAGLTYYASATDTIKHRNSIVSSPSRYHWRIHASSSALATYDFSGLVLIGAGDVVLRNVTTFTGMTFDRCGLITQNGAPMEGCTISSPLDSAGILANNPAVIEGCTFISDGTGHAIEINTPGTYAFTGNQFTGFAASNGSTGNEAIYNNSGGAVTLNIAGGGTVPSIRNGAGATTTVVLSSTLELTGLKNPSEVRVYDAGTTTEITGQETVTTGTYSAAIDAATYPSVDISILSLGYQNMRLLGVDVTSDVSIPIQQALDRQYQNA